MSRSRARVSAGTPAATPPKPKAGAPGQQEEAPLVINGWTLFAHARFLDQIETLARDVGRLKLREPAMWRNKNVTKRLAAIVQLVFQTIPQDPERAEYRQGNSLGTGRRHWFRAKFFQQYRLFFRFHAASRIIIYAWVNDEHTLRAYESGDDAYRTFRRMLNGGNPPDDWDALLAATKAAAPRLKALKPRA